jgi:hypothetical protein
MLLGFFAKSFARPEVAAKTRMIGPAAIFTGFRIFASEHIDSSGVNSSHELNACLGKENTS